MVEGVSQRTTREKEGTREEGGYGNGGRCPQSAQRNKISSLVQSGTAAVLSELVSRFVSIGVWRGAGVAGRALAVATFRRH